MPVRSTPCSDGKKLWRVNPCAFATTPTSNVNQNADQIERARFTTRL
jgi:hypothetical protein